jgi:hypothetical protein
VDALDGRSGRAVIGRPGSIKRPIAVARLPLEDSQCLEQRRVGGCERLVGSERLAVPSCMDPD